MCCVKVSKDIQFLKNKNSCPPEPELKPEPAWEKIVGAGAALKVDGSETLLT